MKADEKDEHNGGLENVDKEIETDEDSSWNEVGNEKPNNSIREPKGKP